MGAPVDSRCWYSCSAYVVLGLARFWCPFVLHALVAAVRALRHTLVVLKLRCNLVMTQRHHLQRHLLLLTAREIPILQQKRKYYFRKQKHNIMDIRLPVKTMSASNIFQTVDNVPYNCDVTNKLLSNTCRGSFCVKAFGFSPGDIFWSETKIQKLLYNKTTAAEAFNRISRESARCSLL